MCTGAAVFNFLHRRGGFAKSWKSIAPAVENAPPRKSPNTDGNLTVLTEKSQTALRGIAFFLMRGPGFATKALGTQCGRLSDSSRTLLGRLPDAPRTPPGRASDASRTLLRRSSDTSRTAPNRTVVCSDSVVFSNSVWLGRRAEESIYIYIYIYRHTYTYTYIYMY